MGGAMKQREDTGVMKLEVTKKTIPQRDGESPPIKMTITRYLPPVRSKGKSSGVTREQFHGILDRASQPIKKPRENVE
jgi:hypothetical protein